MMHVGVQASHCFCHWALYVIVTKSASQIAVALGDAHAVATALATATTTVKLDINAFTLKMDSTDVSRSIVLLAMGAIAT